MDELNQLPQDFTFPPTIDLPQKIRTEILEILWSDLLKGIADVELLADNIDGMLEDDVEVEFDDITVIAEALLAYRRSQLAAAKADGRIQPSRLTKAFEEIAAQNVLALQNFSCCGNCGSAEATEEMYEHNNWGYIYFHEQDTETLIETEETYLGYGVNWSHICTEEEYNALSDRQKEQRYVAACRKLADEVLKPTFEKHGIVFNWNGDLSVRMHISQADYFADLS